MNYRKLLGRIVEYVGTQKELANRISLTESELSRKLNGQKPFNQKDIVEICGVLDLPISKVDLYFFAPDVEKTKQGEKK